MTQPIFMMEFHLGDKEVKFDVLGTSKTVYQVTYPSRGALKCTCPDHVIHENQCKHIFFITEKVLRRQDTLGLGNHTSWEERRENMAKRLSHLITHGRDDGESDVLADEDVVNRYREMLTGVATNEREHRNPECGVCLTDFSEGERGLHVCATCLNAVHAQCWSMWSTGSGSGRRNCVYCRSSPGGPPGQGKWGIQL
jgi:hypothetical protein